MSFVRKITTKKGVTRWQARWRIPGPNGKPIEKACKFSHSEGRQGLRGKNAGRRRAPRSWGIRNGRI